MTHLRAGQRKFALPGSDGIYLAAYFIVMGGDMPEIDFTSIATCMNEVIAMRKDYASRLFDSGAVTQEFIDKHIIKLCPNPTDIIIVKLSSELSPGSWGPYAKKHGEVVRLALSRAGHDAIPILVVRKDVELASLHIPSAQELQNEHGLNIKRLRFDVLKCIARWGSAALMTASLVYYLTV